MTFSFWVCINIIKKLILKQRYTLLDLILNPPVTTYFYQNFLKEISQVFKKTRILKMTRFRKLKAILTTPEFHCCWIWLRKKIKAANLCRNIFPPKSSSLWSNIKASDNLRMESFNYKNKYIFFKFAQLNSTKTNIKL